MQIKRIETKSDREKREKRNKMFIGIVLVIVMLLSTAGYAIIERGKEDKVVYNGIKFTKTDNGWTWITQNFEMLTQFNPREVKNISSNVVSTASKFISSNVYFVAYRFDEKAASDEIYRNLRPSRSQYVCLEENANDTECADLPLKSCLKDNVFVVLVKNETKIYEQDNCVFIESDSDNIIKAADRFLFGAFGVIE